jgi:hypothetical protein
MPELVRTVLFDFITDERFRKSLTSDYEELAVSQANSAWKAVHILAGSIVEAVLVEYLVSTGYKGSKKDPLSMSLSEVIDACKSVGVLSARAADLSSVIRSYRNLIHPGRVVRLNEQVDGNTATIARALVEVVVSEVIEARKEGYGFTAEQIVSKISKDPSTIGVLSHFLKRVNETEKLRLLAEVIPTRYFQLLQEQPPWELDDYSICFAQVYATMPQENQRIVAKKFVKMLHEESENNIHQYSHAFFFSSQIEMLEPSEAELVKAHFLNRLKKEPSNESLIGTLSGFGNLLEEQELSEVTDYGMRLIAYGGTNMKERGRDLVNQLWIATSSPKEAAIKSRISDWIALLKQRELPDALVIAQDLLDNIEIPF